MKEKIMNIKKEYWQPIVVFSILIGLLYWAKYCDEKKEKVILTAKIFRVSIAPSLSDYYEYKYFYKNKIYYGSEFVDETYDSFIGKCFEVSVYLDNPKRSNLNLEREVDCSLFKSHNR
jgi:hypothetical protein